MFYSDNLLHTSGNDTKLDARLYSLDADVINSAVVNHAVGIHLNGGQYGLMNALLWFRFVVDRHFLDPSIDAKT